MFTAKCCMDAPPPPTSSTQVSAFEARGGPGFLSPVLERAPDPALEISGAADTSALEVSGAADTSEGDLCLNYLASQQPGDRLRGRSVEHSAQGATKAVGMGRKGKGGGKAEKAEAAGAPNKRALSKNRSWPPGPPGASGQRRSGTWQRSTF